MKIYRNLILLFILGLIAAACTTIKEVPVTVNTRVLPLGDTVKLHEGALVYALPLTALDFTVVAEKLVQRAGPYHQYAEQFLGLKNVITRDETIWTLKEVKIDAVLEIDPTKYYIIESDGLMQTNAIAMKEIGLILDVNPGIYGGSDYETRSYSDEREQAIFRDMGSDAYYDIEKDTTYTVIDVDTAFVRIPYVLERRRQLNLEEQAENTARILLELREGRHLILTGEATVFPQDQAPIKEINRLEDEYINLFAGKTFKEIRSFRFFFIPEEGMVGRPVILFRFSSTKGVLDPSDVSGRPVVVEMMEFNSNSDLNIIADPRTGVEKFDRIYYRIPEVVNINVTDGKTTLGNTRQLIYQFGPIVTLPANYILGK
jgi:hypothetical protein